MTQRPIFLGACLACALGGAIAGTSLGSTPVLSPADAADPANSAVAQQAPSATLASSSAVELTSDHYPLVTPRGTVAVADLSNRGLFSQARYRSQDAAVATQLASFDDAGDTAAPPRASAGEQSAPQPPDNSLTQPTAPLALRQGPAQLYPARGQARSVHVAAMQASSPVRLIAANASSSAGVTLEPSSRSAR